MACSVPYTDVRCNAEAVALYGIKLLSELPDAFDPSTSPVNVLYTNGESTTESASIWSGQPGFRMKYKYSHDDVYVRLY